MMRLQEADSREQMLFQQEYCATEQARLLIIKNFRVDVEAYVELPVGYYLYSAVDGGAQVKGKVIVLRVMNLQRRLCHFPVFPEAAGKKLLQSWSVLLPPLMTAFAGVREQPAYGTLSESNSSLRTLLEYFRWFTFAANHIYHPLPYGLRTIYNQLCTVPEEGVGAELIEFVNDAVACGNEDKNVNRYTNCPSLEEYIAYLRNKYTLLQFKKADFSILRKLLSAAFPQERIYF